jgi:hypothetical protein
MRYPRWLLHLKAPLAYKLLDGNTIHVAHDLKTWPAEFHAVRRLAKTYEIRRNHDRSFHVGDVLKLSEYVLDEYDLYKEDNPGKYTHRYEVVLVTYVGNMLYTSMRSSHNCVAMSIVRLGLTETRQFGIDLHVQPQIRLL